MVMASPSRTTSTLRVSPAKCLRRSLEVESQLTSVVSPKRRRMSPSSRPALAAGLPSVTWVRRAPTSAFSARTPSHAAFSGSWVMRSVSTTANAMSGCERQKSTPMRPSITDGRPWLPSPSVRRVQVVPPSAVRHRALPGPHFLAGSFES